jgi:transposase
MADKGYDSKALRDTIVNQDAVPVIPPRKTSPQVPCDFALYCERNLVERFFLKIKHFRRIATRYDQTPRAFLSILCLVSARACALERGAHRMINAEGISPIDLKPEICTRAI